MPVISGWFGTFGGLAITAAFGFLCLRDRGRAVPVFVAVAWVPSIHVLTLSGEQTTQGLLLVETLSTAMIAAWLILRLRGPRAPVVPAAVNAPLLLMIPLSTLSLVWGFGTLDPAVPAVHVKATVSFGQILLIAWPVGVYFAVANSVTDTATMRLVWKIVVCMAIPSLALTLAPPPVSRYFVWSVYFALAAGPWFVAVSFDEPSRLKKLGWWLLALSPFVYGLAIGKAFLYVTTAVGLATVVFLRARRLVVIGAFVLLGVYVLAVAATGSALPGPLGDLLDVERRQQSWGGSGGRLALASDAISIWSKHPVFGVGPGNSWPYMRHYSTLDTPHNQYFNILLELGLAGLICFGWFLAAAVRTGLRGLERVRSQFGRSLVAGWLGLFAGMAASGLTGDYFFHSVRNSGLDMFSGYYLQWVLLGLVVAVTSIEGEAA